MIDQLLQLLMPSKYDKTVPAGHAIKLFDAWFNIDWNCYGDRSEPESEEDEDMGEEEHIRP